MDLAEICETTLVEVAVPQGAYTIRNFLQTVWAGDHDIVFSADETRSVALFHLLHTNHSGLVGRDDCPDFGGSTSISLRYEVMIFHPSARVVNNRCFPVSNSGLAIIHGLPK